MKEAQFRRELEKRLKENQELVEHQFLPQRVFGAAAFVGTHLFYVLVTTSLVMAVVTLKFFETEVRIMESILLFL